MLGARTRDSGSASHRICDIFALLNAKPEATSTGWLLEPPLESALRRGTSNLATSAEPQIVALKSKHFNSSSLRNCLKMWFESKIGRRVSRQLARFRHV